MQFLVKLIKPLIKKRVRAILNKQETRQLLVSLANEKIDIPKMTEAEEARLLDRIYLANLEAVNAIIDRI